MTFTLILNDSTTETIDIETLDELTFLSERFGFRPLSVDFLTMTIKVED